MPVRGRTSGAIRTSTRWSLRSTTRRERKPSTRMRSVHAARTRAAARSTARPEGYDRHRRRAHDVWLACICAARARARRAAGKATQERRCDSGGKTNTPEFAVGINTTNQLFGTTHNPYDVSRTSGGSSGGSAVALATGMCVLAEGSDHGGSIRIPSALNNVVGLRTKSGRIPCFPSSWVYDALCVNGPMARSVEDAALMLSVMAGPDARVPISMDESGEAFAVLLRASRAGAWRFHRR